MFKDRKDAGLKLGEALLSYQKDNPIVIGIPRGGIETAFYVAQKLHAEMVPIISRKLGHPQQPEFAMGAIAEDGSYYLSPWAKSEISADDLEFVKNKEKEEIKRRVQLLRHGKPIPNLKDRTVIVVDDGIATGSTLFATLKLCQNQHPKKLIVAAPISGIDAAKQLVKMADKVLILEIPEDFRAVSQGYERFSNLNDEETLEFMRKYEQEYGSHYLG
ncbi:phosphoribosyltransferase [Algoriphagus kandeliae]|uniref:Phosphoribosyltransferase n=1 Tax=Algoriphagus kandeliae TaxID=2562278 RepID=A0A4Y9QPI8_9BACT|nr:phosphoribosyltransferase family protein [Algoriphagus kandeliae]TFV94551.1 phosphoribosyltransferase [Algoriphagus kandeliae]